MGRRGLAKRRHRESRRKEKQYRRDRARLMEQAQLSYRSYNYKLESFNFHDGTLVHHVGRDVRYFYGQPDNARHVVWDTVCGRILCVGEKARFSWTKKAVTCLTCLAGPTKEPAIDWAAFAKPGLAVLNTQVLSRLEFPWDGTSTPVVA